MTKWLLHYLLNSAWQIPVLALCTSSLVRFLRKTRPLFEHRLWVICFLLCLILPLVSLLHVPLTFTANTHSTLQGVVSTANSIERASRIIGPTLDSTGLVKRYGVATVLAWAYLLSLSLGTLKLVRSLVRTRDLVKTSVPIELCSRLHCQFVESARHYRMLPVATYVNVALASPAIVAWPDSRLLLPDGFEQLTDDDAHILFGHELAHVQRRDFYLNLFYESAAILLTYHPVLHWIKRHIDFSREAVCDELAATATIGRSAYARHLLRLAVPPRAKDFATGFSLGALRTTTLEYRIVRLAAVRKGLSRTRRILQTACIATGLAATSFCTALFTLSTIRAQALVPINNHIGATGDTGQPDVSPESSQNSDLWKRRPAAHEARSLFAHPRRSGTHVQTQPNNVWAARPAIQPPHDGLVDPNSVETQQRFTELNSSETQKRWADFNGSTNQKLWSKFNGR